jgi:hypothetical protein
MKDHIADDMGGNALVGRGARSWRPRRAVLWTVREAILANATNESALALAVERHPDSGMNARYVARIRSVLRAEMPEVRVSQRVGASSDLLTKDVAKAAIRADKSNAEVVDEVRRIVPGSRITNGVVSAYRKEMRDAGEVVPGQRDLRPNAPTVQKATVKVDTVGWVAEQAILAGSTDEKVIEAVRSAFPEARTSVASVKFYRWKLRRVDAMVGAPSVEADYARSEAWHDPVC